MKTRLVLYPVLALLAALVIGSQLDRQAQLDPRFLVAVPEPFRAVSQRMRVEIMLAGGAETADAEEARKLVQRQPVPA